MITINDKSPVVHGMVELFKIFGGMCYVTLKHSHNVVLNSGADIMAKAVAGELKINGMYFGYDNSGTPYTDPTPPVERMASFYHSPGAGTMNFVRVPTLAMASYTSTDPAYNGNKVQFVAITDGVGVLPGAGNMLTEGVSQFYGAALAWLDPDNYENDVLFSAVSFHDLGSDHFIKIANAQLGIRWSLIFEVP